jgi:Tfp pilus assembly protein PilN
MVPLLQVVVVVMVVVVVVVVVVFVVVVEQVQSQTYHQVVAELPLPYYNKKAYMYYLKIRM